MTATDLARRCKRLGHRAARRLRLAALANLNATRLVFRSPGRNVPRWIYIGDSHAVHLIQTEFPSPRVAYRDRSTASLYLGPRLLYSVATSGWPRWVARTLRALRTVQRISTAAPIYLVVILGEIDVRCHLAAPGRMDGIRDLAQQAIERAVELCHYLPPASRVVVCSPLPPSQDYLSMAQFPVVGSVAERLHVLGELRSALHEAVDALPPSDVLFFDPCPFVVRADGELRRDLTIDGCHLNSRGAALIRRQLENLVVGSTPSEADLDPFTAARWAERPKR